MLDAMALRRQIVYDHRAKRLFGYVNLGMDDESEEEAKEALVIMAVGLRAKWKAPIAYYLTGGLTAEVQTELVLASLEHLLDAGFQVRSITMDGHPSNVAMCKRLGCNLDYKSLKPYFELPGYDSKIHVIFDACHMVKLIRNAMEAYRTFSSPDGLISWEYIKKLNDTQTTMGLRLANKLSQRHLNFHQQKMKVWVCHLIKH